MKPLSVLACLLMLSPLMAQDRAKAVIKGPTKVNPGNVIFLYVGEGSVGDNYQWELVNSDEPGGQLYDRNGNAVFIFSTITPGSYVFVLAASKADGNGSSTVSLARHTVAVGKPGPLPPGPGPGPDIDPDPPRPDPDPPRPDPDPPKPPKPDLTPDGEKIYQALKDCDTKPNEVKAIAANYKTVAGKAAGLSTWGIGEMTDEFRRLNRRDVFTTEEAINRWMSWVKAHQVIFEKIDGGTKEDYIEKMNEIAEAFDAFIASGSRPVSYSTSGRSSAEMSLLRGIDQLNSRTDDMMGKVGDLSKGLNEADKRLDGIYEKVGL